MRSAAWPPRSIAALPDLRHRAKWHTLLLQSQPITQIIASHNLTNRIRQGGYMAHTLCRCGHTYDVEFESVELALIHACVKGGLHVHGIGVGDIACMRIQRIGNRHQHTVLGVGGRLRQFMLCYGRRVGERVHCLLHVAAHRGL